MQPTHSLCASSQTDERVEGRHPHPRICTYNRRKRPPASPHPSHIPVLPTRRQLGNTPRPRINPRPGSHQARAAIRTPDRFPSFKHWSSAAAPSGSTLSPRHAHLEFIRTTKREVGRLFNRWRPDPSPLTRSSSPSLSPTCNHPCPESKTARAD